MRLLLFTALLVGLPGTVLAEEFIRFAPPIFLAGPSISRSALGATYAYRGRGSWADTELQITVTALPDSSAETLIAKPTDCMGMFLDALRVRSPELFFMPSDEALQTGPLELPQVRWTRRASTGLATGVTACGIYRSRLVAINFATATTNALATLPAVRHRLRELQLNF